MSSRLSTSDLLGPLSLFIGCFLLAGTLALPTLFVDNQRTVPLSTDFTTVAQTPQRATVLDRCSLATPQARTMQAELIRQQRVVAVRPSDSRRITLQAGTSVQAEKLWLDDTNTEGEDPDVARPGSAQWPAEPACNSATLSALTDRVTLNRATALPELGADADGTTGSSEIQYDNTSAPVPAPDRGGYTYALPFDAPTTGVSLFDVTTRQTVPLEHEGEREVAGRTGQVFTGTVPDTDLAAAGSGHPDGVPPTAITRPASWFGVTGGSAAGGEIQDGDPDRELTATLHHRAQWTLVVDQATGVILDETWTVEQSYRIFGEDDFELTALSATFTFTEQTQERMAQRAGDLAWPLLLWGRLVPIVAGILGVLAVGAGIYLTGFRPRRPVTGSTRRSGRADPEYS